MWPKFNNFGEPGDCCLIRGQRWPHRMSRRLSRTNPHSRITSARADVSQLDVTSVTKLARSFCASWLTTSLRWRFQIANNHVKFFAATWHASTEIVGSAKKGEFKLEKSAGTTANNRRTNRYYRRTTCCFDTTKSSTTVERQLTLSKPNKNVHIWPIGIITTSRLAWLTYTDSSHAILDSSRTQIHAFTNLRHRNTQWPTRRLGNDPPQTSPRWLRPKRTRSQPRWTSTTNQLPSERHSPSPLQRWPFLVQSADHSFSQNNRKHNKWHLGTRIRRNWAFSFFKSPNHLSNWRSSWTYYGTQGDPPDQNWPSCTQMEASWYANYNWQKDQGNEWTRVQRTTYTSWSRSSFWWNLPWY